MSHRFTFAGKELLFIHIPKTGGFSICDAFGIKAGGHKPRTAFEDELFSFSFVRNPWDRCVSAFFYLNNGGIDEGDKRDYRIYLSKYAGQFDLFVRETFQGQEPAIFNQKHFRPQYEFVCDPNGMLLVDFIGRFENLQFGYNRLCKLLELPSVTLGHLNSCSHKNYQEYYTPETSQLIRQAYLQDVELFGYTFN